MDSIRRHLLAVIPLTGAFLVSCRPSQQGSSGPTNEGEPGSGRGAETIISEVTTTEDLMRDHAILRRALLVYKESAARMRLNLASVSTEALEKTAQLFRVFGEDYHERKLEEAHIFPSLKRTKSAASSYVDVLIAQHTRGREITDYILTMTAGDKIPTGRGDEFINALETFVRMYEHHAAFEDTLVFPSWRSSASSEELEEIGARFDEIEEEQFHENGFEAALRRIDEIESSLGLTNLATFTAPPPPRAR